MDSKIKKENKNLQLSDSQKTLSENDIFVAQNTKYQGKRTNTSVNSHKKNNLSDISLNNEISFEQNTDNAIPNTDNIIKAEKAYNSRQKVEKVNQNDSLKSTTLQKIYINEQNIDKDNKKADKDDNKSYSIKTPDNLKNKDDKKKKKKAKNGAFWGLSIFIISFILTVIFSFLTEISISNSAAWVCIIVLVALLVLNIGCDILATSVTSCDIEPFYAMASRKIKGAKRAVAFCKNAHKVSSICADVVGDICGIVSGSAGATLVVMLLINGGTELQNLLLSMFVSATIGAMTVGGKAVAKLIAIKYNTEIVFGFSKFTTIFIKEK